MISSTRRRETLHSLLGILNSPLWRRARRTRIPKPRVPRPVLKDGAGDRLEIVQVSRINSVTTLKGVAQPGHFKRRDPAGLAFRITAGLYANVRRMCWLALELTQYLVKERVHQISIVVIEDSPRQLSSGFEI